MRTFNRQIATAIHLNANYASPYVPLKNIFTYAVQAVITGTPTGTIHLEASVDPETNDTQTNTPTIGGQSPANPPSIAPVNWNTITGSAFTVTTSGVETWNVNYTGYTYVRAVYTDTSGGTSTATMTITVNMKGT